MTAEVFNQLRQLSREAGGGLLVIPSGQISQLFDAIEQLEVSERRRRGEAMAARRRVERLEAERAGWAARAASDERRRRRAQGALDVAERECLAQRANVVMRDRRIRRLERARRQALAEAGEKQRAVLGLLDATVALLEDVIGPVGEGRLTLRAGTLDKVRGAINTVLGAGGGAAGAPAVNPDAPTGRRAAVEDCADIGWTDAA